MNINYFPSYISANHLTPPAWEFCGTPCALACLCCSCAFASPHSVCSWEKHFLLRSWIPSVLTPIFTPGKIYRWHYCWCAALVLWRLAQMTPLEIKHDQEGWCYSERTKLKWELQDALCTSSFTVTYKKPYITKMSEWYISKKFLMEIIAIAKSWKQTLD